MKPRQLHHISEFARRQFVGHRKKGLSIQEIRNASRTATFVMRVFQA